MTPTGSPLLRQDTDLSHAETMRRENGLVSLGWLGSKACRLTRGGFVSVALDTMWNTACSALQSALGEQAYHEYVARLRPLRCARGVLALAVEDELRALILEKNYASLITRHVSHVAGQQLRVAFEVVEQAPFYEASVEAPLATAQLDLFGGSDEAADVVSSGKARRRLGRASMPRRIADSGLTPDQTLENFVPSAATRGAHDAVVRVIDHPGTVYSPLVIFGGVGLGKTHLLNACGLAFLQRHPEATVRYVTAEAFVNEWLDANQRRTHSAFRDRYREGVDLLIVDDIQFLAGKARSCDEFFHTINALYQRRVQLVFASDRMPSEIPDLQDRLTSRLTQGLQVLVETPDTAARTEIVQRRAEALGQPLPDDVAAYLAESCGDNVRGLLGGLTQMLYAMQSCDDRPTLAMAQRALPGSPKPVAGRRVTAETIIDAVCDFHHARRSDVLGRGRSRLVAGPRNLAMYLIRDHANLSLAAIGQLFDGRDHSTVLAACRGIEERLRSDDTYRKQVQVLQHRLLHG